MKRLGLLSIGIASLLLTGCSLFNPTPKLVNKYDKIDFKYQEAKHEEWSRNYLNNELTYSTGHYSGSKNGKYFKVYKNDELVYNYEALDGFNISDVKVKDSFIYFEMTTLTIEQDKEKVTDTLYYLDEQFTLHKLYESVEANIEYLNLGSSLYFIETIRGTTSSKLVNLDYEGNLIYKVDLNLNEKLITSLVLVDTNKLLLSTTDKLDHYYLFSSKGEMIKKIASTINLIPKEVSYVNEELYVLGYQTTYVNFDLSNYKIVEYKNDEHQVLYDIDLPEDYGYLNELFVNYHDNIYLSFSVSEKDKSKSLYSRNIILKCSKSKNKIETLYLNKNLSYNVFYQNGVIYLGNFVNDKYVDNESSGDFISIDLNQFD